MYNIDLYKRGIQENYLSRDMNIEFDINLNEDIIQLVNINIVNKHKVVCEFLQISVNARLKDRKYRKKIGEIITTLDVFNPIFATKSWDWILDYKDISIIENVRHKDVHVDIEISILVQITENGMTKIFNLEGKNSITLLQDFWLDFTRKFGYSTKYDFELLSSTANDQEWFHAVNLLQHARHHMQRGQTYDSLRQCLSIIESYMDSKKRGGPYSGNVFEELLENVGEQKKTALLRLITGISTYLNMVGHHRDSNFKEDGVLHEVAINQYEAEILVSMSHLLVTYLEHLRREKCSLN
ncbi:hypothetical protein L2089_15345 [Paenibacillus hunanensis]|uniref:hypothetical protein n=1 Tax=Paenibacillus hunanensis TaxID=539262 RepID=UPI0020263D25|nr:hypothetical protein [Paenibacillus hunanensis]MCL9662068.1 hypothetical protein [Paenibacillus hunanensis]